MIQHPLFFLLFLLPALCLGAETRETEITGTIAVIHRQGALSSIVVNDEQYLVPPAIRVERSAGQAATSSNLREGQRIRLRYEVNDQGERYLVRIQLLSEDARNDHGGSGFSTSGSLR